jgi:hypothetical protein
MGTHKTLCPAFPLIVRCRHLQVRLAISCTHFELLDITYFFCFFFLPVPLFRVESSGAEGYDIAPFGDEIAFAARNPLDVQAQPSSVAWTTTSHIFRVAVTEPADPTTGFLFLFCASEQPCILLG